MGGQYGSSGPHALNDKIKSIKLALSWGLIIIEPKKLLFSQSS
jgi:hypothetical protein